MSIDLRKDLGPIVYIAHIAHPPINQSPQLPHAGPDKLEWCKRPSFIGFCATSEWILLIETPSLSLSVFFPFSLLLSLSLFLGSPLSRSLCAPIFGTFSRISIASPKKRSVLFLLLPPFRRSCPKNITPHKLNSDSSLVDFIVICDASEFSLSRPTESPRNYHGNASEIIGTRSTLGASYETARE